MKWSLAAFLALLLAAAVALPAAAQLAARDGEAVTYTPVVQYGDESAAEGIEVRVTRNWDWRLYWDTVWTPEGSETTFRLGEHSASWSETERGAIELGVCFDVTGGEITGLDHAVNAMTSVLASGGSRTRINLAECYDYLPLEIAFRIPEGYFIVNEASSQDTFGWSEAYAKLSDYFRIPVPENLGVWVNTVHGSGDTIRVTSVEADEISIKNLSAETDGWSFFTFTADRELDFSLIPGGWGVYRMPCDGDVYDVAALETALSFDDGVSPLRLEAADGKLVLHSSENGRYVVSVYNAQSMELLQRMELFDMAGGEAVQVHSGDGYMAVIHNGEFAALQEESGLYELWLTGEWRWDEEYCAEAFSGDRFAVVGDLFPRDYSSSDNYLAFFLAVYSQDGLEYYGEYACSLEDMHPGMWPCLTESGDLEISIGGELR